jgi:hypothetical protein
LYGENIFFPLKTSSDRLKLTYKTKKKKIDVKARTTVQEDLPYHFRIGRPCPF